MAFQATKQLNNPHTGWHKHQGDNWVKQQLDLASFLAPFLFSLSLFLCVFNLPAKRAQ